MTPSLPAVHARLRICLAIGLLVLGVTADARMYQWRDPLTGSVQMSGKPPAWYRSSWQGPRVRVFDNGTIVDDTAIEVSDDEMQALRDEAFRQFDQAQELAALKRLEKQALKDAERDERESRVDELLLDDLGDEQDEVVPDSIDEDTIEELKDLIDEWDTLNLPFGE